MPPKKGDKRPTGKLPAPSVALKKIAAKKHADGEHPEEKPGKPHAKKHAKDHDKHPKKHGKKHGHSKDMRRAFEHLNRVHCLHDSLDRAAARSVDTLATLAQQQLASGEAPNAADLLRAAEHLAFAFLADDAPAANLSPQLLDAIHEQIERLDEKADEHWRKPHQDQDKLAGIYDSARKASAKSLKDKQYHRALEFQRAAESLAHVKLEPTRKLDAGRSGRQAPRQLEAS